MTGLIERIATYFEPYSHCLCITGSGGKTTLLIALAREYAQRGKRVLISTTTKLESPHTRDYGCDSVFLDNSILTYQPVQGERVFYAHPYQQKACAPPQSELELLLQSYDVMLLEADGARRMMLKMHGERDPVIPAFASATIAVVGLSAWGKPMCEVCFGWKGEDQMFDQSVLETLLHHPQGILKGATGPTLILLNQAELLADTTLDAIGDVLKGKPHLIGFLQTDTIHEGII